MEIKQKKSYLLKIVMESPKEEKKRNKRKRYLFVIDLKPIYPLVVELSFSIPKASSLLVLSSN